MSTSKARLDVLLVDQGFAESRERAQRLILAGVVWCRGERLDKPGIRLDAESPLEVRGDPCPYVSRGGLKLAGALDRLGVDPRGLVCADLGASTGGFTDCLLQRGAARVHAIDVGRHQLHERLRADPRVISREQVNARNLTAESLPERVDLVTIDVSFISLALVLPGAAAILAPGGRVLALVKPQFEAGPAQVRKGVVADPAVHREVLAKVDAAAREIGWKRDGACPSPLRGPAGNREQFVLWSEGFGTESEDWIRVIVEEAWKSDGPQMHPDSHG